MSIALLRPVGAPVCKLAVEASAVACKYYIEAYRNAHDVDGNRTSPAISSTSLQRPRWGIQRGYHGSTVNVAADGSTPASASRCTGSTNIKMPHIEPQLNVKDETLVRLFMASCYHKWELLHGLGTNCYKQGCSIEEVRGCVRHLIVVAGYGPCLATTLHLHKAKLLPEETPGKVGGAPGDAFELVYGSVTDKVRRNMHAADPVLGELIRLHLYGDIYSSPGISLRQKQLLMVSFLGQANMHDQLFGHLIAAFRFGVQQEEALKAIDCAFELDPVEKPEIYQGSLKTLALAIRKFRRSSNAGEETELPSISIPDPNSVRIPSLPPLFNHPSTEDTSSTTDDLTMRSQQRLHNDGATAASSTIKDNNSEDLELEELTASAVASRTMRPDQPVE